MREKKDIADIKCILQLHENIKRLELLSSRMGSEDLRAYTTTLNHVVKALEILTLSNSEEE